MNRLTKHTLTILTLLCLLLATAATMGAMPITHTDSVPLDPDDPWIGQPLGPYGIYLVGFDDCAVNPWATCDRDYNDRVMLASVETGAITTTHILSAWTGHRLITPVLTGGQVSYAGFTTPNQWFWVRCATPGGCDPPPGPEVPEPASASMLGLGLILLGAGLIRRARMRKEERYARKDHQAGRRQVQGGNAHRC